MIKISNGIIIKDIISEKLIELFEEWKILMGFETCKMGQTIN